MLKLVAVSILLSTTLTFAGTLPTNKAEFCARYADTSGLSTYSSESSNLMSFKNDGGIFNGGVCWWHSRFQRNIFYLSIFRPDLNPPSLSNARALIKEIRAGQSIVTIPGFSNFAEFSAAYKNEIQAELNAWQRFDGIVWGVWIDGLKGSTKVKPEVLNTMMDTVYQYVEVDKKIAYQKLQIKGITSHAWLIVGMKKAEAGYEIGLIDSNMPRMSRNYTYKIGDSSFNEKSYGDFVPYLEFTREESRISSVAKKFCGIEDLNASHPAEWARDYELDLLEAKNQRSFN